MKITEQFDDVETEYIPISKMGRHRRRFLRRKNDHSIEAARKKSQLERGIKHRQEPSRPRFKCLEDA